jgi:formamidopyrimidine-DNA glycosylase
MPEGDTIFRAARTLNRALAGKRVEHFESMLPSLNRVHEDAPLTGRTIEKRLWVYGRARLPCRSRIGFDTAARRCRC